MIEECWTYIKLKKCSFGVSEWTYLGHKIRKGGVRPEETKVKAITDMSRPRTKKKVQSFLGMVGYHRQFIYRTLLPKQNHSPTKTRKAYPKT